MKLFYDSHPGVGYRYAFWRKSGGTAKQSNIGARSSSGRALSDAIFVTSQAPRSGREEYNLALLLHLSSANGLRNPGFPFVSAQSSH
jgi:hypothetical protein